MALFVAVHVGAGYHSPNNESEYKEVCKTACLQAMELLKKNGKGMDVVTEATVALENGRCTNAGVGSSLTMDATVECDASLMDGESNLFGAVGCLSGVKNPILAARKLVETQKHSNMSLGRIPPSILVGHGARKWCEENGIETCDSSLLVTDSSKRKHFKYKRKMDAFKTDSSSKPKQPKVKTKDESIIQDTVGAVCLDSYGNMAATSSSGGIWLKHSGRLGPAAVYGAGCWAKNRPEDNTKSGVSISTSGSGEDIIRCLLAKTCADSIVGNDNIDEAINTVFKQEFHDNVIGNKEGKNGGVIVLKSSDINSVELLWAHTTDSMCVGYFSSLHKNPQTFVSRLPSGCESGFSLTIQGKYFNFTNKK